jgi:hypothetical protein
VCVCVSLTAQLKQRRLDSLVHMIDAINANSFRGATNVAQAVIDSACSVVSEVGMIVLYLVKETKVYSGEDEGRGGDSAPSYTLVPLACSHRRALRTLPVISISADTSNDKTALKLLRCAREGLMMNMVAPNTTDAQFANQLIVPIKDDTGIEPEVSRASSTLSELAASARPRQDSSSSQSGTPGRVGGVEESVSGAKRHLDFRSRYPSHEAKESLKEQNARDSRVYRSDSPVIRYQLQHQGDDLESAQHRSETMNAVAVLHVVNKEGGNFSPFEEVLFRSLASCAAQALKKAQIYGALVHEQTKSYALLSLLQAQDEASRGKKGLVHITRTIIQVAQSVLAAQKMGLFFVDRVREQLFCTVSTDQAAFSISINRYVCVCVCVHCE